MNVPHVKEFDKLGRCTNPITRTHLHRFPNRRARRYRDTSSKRPDRYQIIALTDSEGRKIGKYKTIKHFAV